MYNNILFFVFPLQHLQQAYTPLKHNGIWWQTICHAIYPSATNLSSRRKRLHDYA